MAALDIVTTPSSKGWRSTSRTLLLNSGSSSRKSTPWWARLIPGTGDRSSAYENKPVIVEKVIELKRPLLNERQKFFLKMLEEKGKVARAEYMKMFKRKFSRITLYWDLRVLIELGIIEKIKVGRFVYYRLKSRSER